jgi:urease accessory protein
MSLMDARAMNRGNSHSHASGNPVKQHNYWMPAGAGMTDDIDRAIHECSTRHYAAPPCRPACRLARRVAAGLHCTSHTVLSHRQHVGPLLVQRPFYPEGPVCHVYVIHPPGGIAGGDHLQLKVLLAAGAHALITTPAATKFYRAAAGRQSVLLQRLQLQAATLEWLPQEAIFFDQAQVRTTTRIELDAQSRFIGWELNCYGRRAGDLPFASGNIRQHLELWRDGKPVLLDRLRIEGGGEMQTAAWGLHGLSALGSLLAYPANASDVHAVRELPLNAQQISCTLVDGVLLCRCLCTDGAELKQNLLQVWQCLRPRIVQRDAVLPRIWAT